MWKLRKKHKQTNKQAQTTEYPGFGLGLELKKPKQQKYAPKKTKPNQPNKKHKEKEI